MLTIENTDQPIKVFENCASMAIEPTTTFLLAGASHDDNPEMVTMRDEFPKKKVLVETLGTTSMPTTTTGAAHTDKRTRVYNNAYRAQGHHHMHRLQEKMGTMPMVVGSTRKTNSRKQPK